MTLARLFSSIMVFATLAASQAPVNPPWELQTFSYGWVPQNDTITQCRDLDITWSSLNVSGAPAISPPYTIIWYLAGYEPYRLQMGAGSPGGFGLQYGWFVNLPTGGPYIHSMIDGVGANGGVSVIVLRNVVQLTINRCALKVSDGITNILSPTNGACTVQPLSPATLDFVVPDTMSVILLFPKITH